MLGIYRRTRTHVRFLNRRQFRGSKLPSLSSVRFVPCCYSVLRRVGMSLELCEFRRGLNDHSVCVRSTQYATHIHTEIDKTGQYVYVSRMLRLQLTPPSHFPVPVRMASLYSCITCYYAVHIHHIIAFGPINLCVAGFSAASSTRVLIWIHNILFGLVVVGIFTPLQGDIIVFVRVILSLSNCFCLCLLYKEIDRFHDICFENETLIRN